MKFILDNLSSITGFIATIIVIYQVKVSREMELRKKRPFLVIRDIVTSDDIEIYGKKEDSRIVRIIKGKYPMLTIQNLSSVDIFLLEIHIKYENKEEIFGIDNLKKVKN